MRSRAFCTAGVLTLALAAAFACSPVAASVVRSGGVAYKTKELSVKPGKFVRTTSACPKHTQALGGGEAAHSGFGTIALRETYPADLGDRDHKPDDGWGVAVFNRGKKRAQIDVMAACGHAQVTYAKEKVAVSRHSFAEHDLDCPGSLHGYSGGVRTKTKALRLDSTFPTDSGWGGYYAGAKALEATAYAVCLKPKPVETEKSIPLVMDTELGGRADCPANKRTYGAGLSTSAGGSDHTINSLLPVPPIDPSTGGGASGYMDFTSDYDGILTITATCGPKL